MIRANGIGRTFVGRSGAQIAALVDFNLTLSAGTFVVIHGPSGCGKSTLLNLFGLLDSPSEGQLFIDQTDVGRLDRRGAAAFRRENIGFLFQDAGLVEPMTVRDNLDLPLAYRGRTPSERERLFQEMLEAVGLPSRLNSRVGELSGGERQRVGLARALVARPRLLICDEPTAALDEANSVSVAEILKAEAARGVLVIASSHDPVLIGLADQLVHLRHGRQVDEDHLALA